MINWENKKHGKKVFNGDICIREHLKDKKIRMFSVYIKSEKIKDVSRTQFVRIAVSNNKLYFDDDCTSLNGWKIQKEGENFLFKVRKSTLSKNAQEVIEPGNYRLQFDPIAKYFFIDLDDKLERKLAFERSY